MLLYHYTSLLHLLWCFEAKAIKTVEIRLREDDPAVPGVVWLTSDESLSDAAVEKRDVRIAVEVGDAQLWLLWAREHGVSGAHVDRLVRPAGGGEQAATYVVERPIPWREWVELSIASAGIKHGQDSIAYSFGPLSPWAER